MMSAMYYEKNITENPYTIYFTHNKKKQNLHNSFCQCFFLKIYDEYDINASSKDIWLN